MTISTGMRNAHIIGKFMVATNNFNNGICAFASVGNQNSHNFLFRIKYEAPCHARLNGMDSYEKVVKGEPNIPDWVPHKIVDVLYPSKLSDEIRLLWYQFILERSVYAPIFAESKALIGFKRGYYIYNTDVEANLLAGGAIAIRMATEYNDYVNYWYKLVQSGADEDIAYLMAFSLYENDSNYLGMRTKTEQYHVSIVPHYFNDISLKKYLLKDYSKVRNYVDRRRYQGIFHMFGEGNVDNSILHKIECIWKKTVEEQAVKKVKRRVALFNLPWNKANKNKTTLPNDKGYPLMAKIINEYKQEILNA